MQHGCKMAVTASLLALAAGMAVPVQAGPTDTDPRLIPIEATALRRQIAGTPLSSDAHQMLIARAFNSKLSGVASDLYKQVANRNPNSAQANLWAGTACASHYAILAQATDGGENRQARALQEQVGKYLRRALQLAPTSGLAQAEFGYWRLRNESSPDEGMTYLTQSVQLAPRSGRTWFLYGIALSIPSVAFYNPARAESAYKKAIALDARYSSPYYGLAHLYFDQKRYAEAREAMATYDKCLPPAARQRPDPFRDAVRAAR